MINNPLMSSQRKVIKLTHTWNILTLILYLLPMKYSMVSGCIFTLGERLKKEKDAVWFFIIVATILTCNAFFYTTASIMIARKINIKYMLDHRYIVHATLFPPTLKTRHAA